MPLPTATEIRQFHRSQAPSDEVFESVFIHCTIVAEIAQQLVRDKALEVDHELLEAGCMLHDIGVYEVIDANGGNRPDRPYITHGVRGEAILRAAGYAEELCRIASHHTGVGITRTQIEERGLPLPLGDYTARTVEEELVMYADKFHSKSRPPRFNAPATYRSYVRQFGDENAAAFDAFTERFGLPDLAALSARYGHGIV